MYAEELKQKQVGPLKGLLLTFVIVACLFVGMFFLQVVQIWLGVYWLQFVFYGLVIIGVFFIIKYRFVEYIYLIEKDRITFGRRIGKREKEVLFVPFREIITFGKYAELQGKLAGKKVFKFTFHKKEEAFVIICSKCAVIMSPTKEYIDSLCEVKNRRKQTED